MRPAVVLLMLAVLVAGCEPDLTESPPDAGRMCPPAPVWSSYILGAYGCGMDNTEDACPVCLVWLREGDESPLVVPGGLCGQVPVCAERYRDALETFQDAGARRKK
jgi:hypothetical protein